MISYLQHHFAPAKRRRTIFRPRCTATRFSLSVTTKLMAPGSPPISAPPFRPRRRDSIAGPHEPRSSPRRDRSVALRHVGTEKKCGAHDLGVSLAANAPAEKLRNLALHATKRRSYGSRRTAGNPCRSARIAADGNEMGACSRCEAFTTVADLTCPKITSARTSPHCRARSISSRSSMGRRRMRHFPPTDRSQRPTPSAARAHAHAQRIRLESRGSRPARSKTIAHQPNQSCHRVSSLRLRLRRPPIHAHVAGRCHFRASKSTTSSSFCTHRLTDRESDPKHSSRTTCSKRPLLKSKARPRSFNPSAACPPHSHARSECPAARLLAPRGSRVFHSCGPALRPCNELLGATSHAEREPVGHEGHEP